MSACQTVVGDRGHVLFGVPLDTTDACAYLAALGEDRLYNSKRDGTMFVRGEDGAYDVLALPEHGDECCLDSALGAHDCDSCCVCEVL